MALGHPGTRWETQRLWGGLRGAVPSVLGPQMPGSLWPGPGASSPGEELRVTGAHGAVQLWRALASQEAGRYPLPGAC